MRCRFEGVFTDEERRCIRARLRAMDVAADVLGFDLGDEWVVRHTVGEECDEFSAHHVESGAVLWARSVCKLGDEIHKAARFLGWQ